jgi:hypothetical protein
MECRLYLADAPRGAEYAADEVVDLGRSWEAMNFLLTGKRETGGGVGSLLVEDWPDIGGSEAAMIDAHAIRAFSDWLASQTDDEILGRFDPEAMLAADVYEAGIICDNVDAGEAFAKTLTSLRAFMLRGTQIGSGAIRVIN